MHTDTRILIMTGDQLRHKYFALKLLKKFPHAHWLIECHYKDPLMNYKQQKLLAMYKHFKQFQLIEKKYFNKTIRDNYIFLRKKIIAKIKPGTINNKDIVDKIIKLNPELIIVHSTSIIKDKLIIAFPKKIINLHAGLSPYYRGSGTNIWPFFNKELQYVGMTVHYLDKGIDSGDIILQGRPKFSLNDNTHTIGCKNIILGTKLMIKVIKKYLIKGSLKGVIKNKIQGKLYLKKDFNLKIIKMINKNLQQGMVRKYLKNKNTRIKIVTD